MNIDNRKKYSLNGKWKIIIDPYECGYYDSQYQIKKDGYFKNAKPVNKSDRVEYSFEYAETLDVPGDWNTQQEKLFFYEGTIWYKKSFDYSKKDKSKLFVYFGAANYYVHVYLNGKKLGEHEGGFTPFHFEITDQVKKEDNFLVVKVDNSRHPEGVPTINTDWWNYGGLTRRVLLVEVPETYIEDYFIQLKKGSLKQIRGWIRLNGKKLIQKGTIKIPELKMTHPINTTSEGVAEIDFDAELEHWSPENPKLYEMVITTETDEVRDWIGFRSIETQGTDILLNGNPILLRGISIHEEAPLRGGRAWSSEDARILLKWAKELNCNFVRLAHYPHNEFMTRQADRMGLLVWSEIPVYWTIAWEKSNTFKNAQRQLTDMMMRDKNRSSVILWSIANETPVTEARTTFIKNLIQIARNLDPTRLITAALNRMYVNEHTIKIDDPLGEYIDVVGYNEYFGWYSGLPEDCERIKWMTSYEKPHIMSEFGGGALYGYHGDPLTRWSEEYQESLYKHQSEMLQKIPFLRGITPWILMDFRSPRRPLPHIQDYWNRKGLISNRGYKKKAFFILQKFYNELKEKAINTFQSEG